MGWREIPGVRGWKVNEELTIEGRLLLKRERGAQSLFYPLNRLNALTDRDFEKDNDPRVREKEDGLVEVSVHGDVDLKLLCTPIDYGILLLIRNKWQRDKWQDLEEQKLLEKCLDELYGNGTLAPETATELKEYQKLLRIDKFYMKEPDGVFDEQTVSCHSMFVQTGLNFELDLVESDVRLIQEWADAKPTGRYDLQTARAVKYKQQELKDDKRCNGPVDGIWNERLKPFLEIMQREEALLAAGRNIVSVLKDFPYWAEEERQRQWANHARTELQRHLAKLHKLFREKHNRDPARHEDDAIAEQIRLLNQIEVLIELGLNTTRVEKQRAYQEVEAELEKYWSEFFSEGGRWQELTNQFQIECIELWITAASFAYSAATVGIWVRKKVIKTAATKAVGESLARRPPSDLRFLQRLPAMGAARNKLKAELARLGRKAITSTGKKGSQTLVRMAKKAGLKVVPGGNHWTVKNYAGRPITQIPHSLKNKWTAKGIIRAIERAAGF